MPHRDRPQSPGYLANLMARLFHEVAAEGFVPLGIDPATFPVLVELWFGDTPVTRESLRASQEAEAETVDALVRPLAAGGLVENFPADPVTPLALTARGLALRDPAITAARRANAAALAPLSEAEAATFLATMNRVIDALQAAKT